VLDPSRTASSIITSLRNFSPFVGTSSDLQSHARPTPRGSTTPKMEYFFGLR
jgi:hypothetical protein